MKPVTRPVYLNPFRIHLPITGWVSILHRVSGAGLFLTFPVGVWALARSLSGEAGFQQVAESLAHPMVKGGLLILFWAFAHHFLAGLRHLALDMHWGVQRVQARTSSAWVLMLSGALTAYAAWGVFA